MYNSNDGLLRLIDKFRKYMKEELDAKRQAISSGHFEDMIKYKYECGLIAGLDASLQVFNDMVKTIDSDAAEEFKPDGDY